jgi:hypothetical protein
VVEWERKSTHSLFAAAHLPNRICASAFTEIAGAPPSPQSLKHLAFLWCRKQQSLVLRQKWSSQMGQHVREKKEEKSLFTFLQLLQGAVASTEKKKSV